jgi:hypothetical protein
MAQVSIGLFLFHLSYPQRRQHVVPPPFCLGYSRIGTDKGWPVFVEQARGCLLS